MSGSHDPRRRSEEQRWLAAKDKTVRVWHKAAKAGDAQARHDLLGWAYMQAQAYYQKRVRSEKHLTSYDVEELTTNFFMNFEATWPQMHKPTHYTRKVMKNMLQQYLMQQRRQWNHETDLDLDNPPLLMQTGDEPAWASWDDETWWRYEATQQVLQEADAQTREIMAYRTQDPPLGYEEIAYRVGSTAASLRMRVSRLYATIRRRYNELTGGDDP